MTDAYPMAWPEGWPRTPLERRPVGRSNFMRGDWRTGRKRPWSLAEARDELLDELRRFKASQVVISSDFPLNRDGSLSGNARKPVDQGIAIYFLRGKTPYVMAMDEWADAESNLRSLALSIEALRQLQRHGGGKMLERAFSGFVALPAPKKPHEILGVERSASKVEINRAWRDRIATAHPDQGGTQAAAAEINAARDAMLKSLGA